MLHLSLRSSLREPCLIEHGSLVVLERKKYPRTTEQMPIGIGRA